MGVTLPTRGVLERRNRLEQIINPIPGLQVGSYVENGVTPPFAKNCTFKPRA